MNGLCQHIVSAPVVLLTGAGASVALGKPTTVEFAKRAQAAVVGAMARVVEGDAEEVWRQLVASCRERWGADPVDVEMILEHLRDQIECLDCIRGDYNLRGRAPIRDGIYEGYAAAERRLCRLVLDQYSDVDADEAKALYEPMLAGLRARPHLHTLPIFTLNYDVAVERAATAMGIGLVDGVRRAPPADSRWSAAQFHDYVPRDEFTVVLFKLHGSTTWAWRRDDSLVELPFGTGKDPGSLKHALLYPYFTQKDLDKEPFRTGYAYLRACLASAEFLVIIGTSLRDRHVVEILEAAFVGNPGLAVALVDPSLDADQFGEIVHGHPALITSIKEGFDPETSRALPGLIIKTPPPKRRRRKGAA